MKILVLPGYYGFGGHSGFGTSSAGIFFKQQAEALARYGHDVSLLYVHFDGTDRVDVEELDESGVHCIYVHAQPLKVPLNLIYRILLTVWAFHRYFGADLPEVLHAHSYRAGLYSRPLSRIWRIPYVITEHSSTLERGIPWVWRLVARWSFAGAACVVAVSDGLADTMRHYTRRKVEVVPNLVHQSFFTTPICEGPVGVGTPFHFVSVGRSDPIKAWDVLIPAFAECVHSGMDATLTLCGGGDETPQLQALASRLGVSDLVVFAGKLDHQAVLELIQSCHCHVLASRIETFGIVSIEALALGKPIIMTATNAASIIVRSHNGLVIPIDDPAALSNAMKKMVENFDSYDPQAIRKDCYDRFSEDAVCRRLTALYASV